MAIKKRSQQWGASYIQEEWEIHNFAPKTTINGISYNEITISEDIDEDDDKEHKNINADVEDIDELGAIWIYSKIFIVVQSVCICTIKVTTKT